MYAVYVSNENLAVNGVAVEKQLSQTRCDGVWARVIPETVDVVSCVILWKGGTVAAIW